MTSISILPGDNRQSLRRLIDDGVRVHSVVTDPPYGLVSVQKRFGKEGSAPARTDKNDGSFARLSGGFMGKQWDATEIERDPDFWRLIYDILLPGGYVFAFSGARTGHWQAVAMELAGFVMHPMHGWLYHSGFPKAHAADKAIDKALGAEREVIGTRTKNTAVGGNDLMRNNGKKTGAANYGVAGGDERVSYKNVKLDITRAATPEAQQWEGWAYGTQAQKPALEPIFLGQKPFSENTGAANLLKHGVGAVNIDGCRVTTDASEIVIDDGRRVDMERDTIHQGYDRPNATMFRTGKPAIRGGPSNDKGRHPANIFHDGSVEVLELFPDSKGQQGDVRGTEQSRTGDENTNCYGEFNRIPSAKRNDSGSSARFYNCFPPDEAPPIFVNKKANKEDRAGSRHPTVKPVSLMQHLIRHITPPGGVVLDPFAGSGTTGEAATREGFDCILMEAEQEYIDFLHERFENQPQVESPANLKTSLFTNDLDDLLG
jgi:DNA modification methylase